MQVEIDEIKKVFEQYSKSPLTQVDRLPQAGSERHYFRLHTAENTYIATYGANVKENEAFIYFSNQFHQQQLATPQILYSSADNKIYFQQDFGDTSLLNQLEGKGFTDSTYLLYKKVYNN